MSLLLAALVVLVSCALAALCLCSRARLAGAVGATGAVVAWALSVPLILRVLLGGEPVAASVAWLAPFGTLTLGLDALSAYFLLLILTLSALAAVYGVGYLHDQPRDGASWFFFDLLVASMAVVVMARHALVFLVAWETMALTSFFLVVHYCEQRAVRRAAWVYLIAAHLASMFLLPMFLLLAPATGSLAFADLGSALAPATASWCFVLGVLGFGCKAGLMPLHVWLPEAHPAAPSHVSALLSGVMIKTGIYGLLRLLTLLGPPPLWWGGLLLVLGVVSALVGVLLALAQHDLKRLLAYSTVENVGLITCGLGAGLCGVALGSPALAVLGLAGALLHTAYHALFKGLAFLGAGAVLRATGTAEMDTLGGLQRRMPWTAGAFLVGVLAICGLPPLNGFASELLLFFAMLTGVLLPHAHAAAALGGTAVALAATGALSLAGFAKVYGIVFLGEPRGSAAAGAVESPWLMRLPMLALAGLCVATGFASPWFLPVILRVVEGLVPAKQAAALAPAAALLVIANSVGGALVALAALLAIVRLLLLRGRDVRRQPTWDCGYVAPAVTMQYTASSFSQPIVDLFGAVLRTRKRVASPEIHFPDAAHVETETPDLSREGIYEPVFEGVRRALSRILILQHGRLQVYVLGVVLTLLALLLWQVR